MLDRKFRVLGVGSRLKILSSRPSTHTDKFGGTSNSVYAEVIGIGIIEPQEILQREPFLTVECSPFSDGDSLLLASPNAAPTIAEYRASLSESAALCESLSDVAKPAPGTPPSQVFLRGSGGWSLVKCVNKVLEVRNALREGGNGDDPASDTAVVRLSALACTAHLPGEDRLKAMELAQQGQLAGLLEYVQSALKEEGQRRLAVKALAGALGGGGEGSSRSSPD